MATKSETVGNPNSCLERAQDDEPVFVLVARDKLAPEAVRNWARDALLHGVPQAKVDEAWAVAYEMENYQRSHPERVKFPD